MQRKERNQTNNWQSSRSSRREAEVQNRDLPKEVWEVQQRPHEGVLISFSVMETALALFSQSVPRIRDVSFVGTKERGKLLRHISPNPQPLSVFPLNLGERTLEKGWEVMKTTKMFVYLLS